MAAREYAAGIDLGGTAIKYGIVDDGGTILWSDRRPTCANEGTEAVKEQIVCAARACCDEARQRGIALSGIGIGTPGVVSPEGVVTGGAENLPGWEGIDLAGLLNEATGLRAVAGNDANVMALAETLFGAARGASDVIFLTIGTGIGGGVLIDGKLFGGYRNCGTELGHITLKYDGEECACGSRGCLEHYASTAALVRRYRERCHRNGLVASASNGEELVALYHKGDRMAVESMEEHWDFLAYGITSLVHIFAPQRIVIGGGISEAGAFYIEALRGRVNRLAMEVCRADLEIVAAELGNRAGCLGAAGLILNK